LDKGLRLTAQDGTNHDLTKADFQKMIDSDGKEFKICLKLTQQVIDVKGQTRQRVRPAARLLSNTVGKAILRHFGEDYKVQSDAVLCINRWFDTMNSRSKYNNVSEKCGFGIYENDQQQALTNMENFINNMDFCNKGKRRQAKVSIPFQRAILVSIKSTRALFAEVKAAQIPYLILCKVNTDPVENYFSHVRGIGGDNSHPGPATAVYRMRILLIGKDPAHVVQRPNVQIAGPEEAVDVGANNLLSLDTQRPAHPVGDLYADPVEELELENFITKTLTADIPDEVELADPDLDDFEDIKVTFI
jgi:hypothetical protein